MFWIGVDWGTQSSKWTIQREDHRSLIVGGILDSSVNAQEGEIVFSPGQEITPSPYSLKRAIIRDPMASFWDGDRADTHTSLGEAVCFSLTSVLGDIAAQGESRGIDITRSEDIEFGFSLPNWLGEIDRGARVATNNFHDAVEASLWLLREMNQEGLPRAGVLYPIDKWKNLVTKARDQLPQGEATIDTRTLTTTFHQTSGTRWSYLIESCAAGLPYLRAIDIRDFAPPGLPWLIKLLVVDVGAGSTDVGYMIRTEHVDSHRELLHYFTPAPALELAGNSLTSEIRNYYRSKGHPRTFVEAENIKTDSRQAEEWRNLSFAENWRKEIGYHTKQYVTGIPDKKWLARDVKLLIVLTGGSAAVPGLTEEVQRAVTEALEEQRFPTSTEVVNLKLPGLDLRNDAEYGRRAVSIGASDQNKPSLKYLKGLGE